jgi:transposase
MQGVKTILPKTFYQLHLDELVSKDNFYRRLNAALDLRFLYKQTKKYYGTEGQQSIDPVVFFKIILVGYLNNINSDRRLIEYCSNCLDIRLFLQYDLDEQLPWHSTISRTRQLLGEEVFLSLFQKILSLCIGKGMVRGKRQALDSAFVKANASLDSLVEKEILHDAAQYAQELSDNNEQNLNTLTPQDKASTGVGTDKKKSVERHHNWKRKTFKGRPGSRLPKEDKEEQYRPKLLSNHTHASPTDPDARIAVKPGKARQMNYYAQVTVDEAHHVITASGADFADKRDSECLPHIMNQNLENLKEHGLKPEQLLADTGYSSEKALQYCNQHNIDAYIPNFGQYKPEREGLIYNAEQDRYECTRGQKAILPFRKIITGTRGNEKKEYRSDSSKCKDCPLRSECIGKSSFKKVEDILHRHLYDAMHQKLKTAKGKRIAKKRGRIVEPVLGTLLNFLNLRRVNTRGIKQANKHVMMAALAYNLKKYLRFTSRKAKGMVMAMEREHFSLPKPAITCFLQPF